MSFKRELYRKNNTGKYELVSTNILTIPSFPCDLGYVTDSGSFVELYVEKIVELSNLGDITNIEFVDDADNQYLWRELKIFS